VSAPQDRIDSQIITTTPTASETEITKQEARIKGDGLVRTNEIIRRPDQAGIEPLRRAKAVCDARRRLSPALTISYENLMSAARRRAMINGEEAPVRVYGFSGGRTGCASNRWSWCTKRAGRAARGAAA